MLGNMLIDTNILLSAILKQGDYINSRKLLKFIEKYNIEITILDFAFYSTCITLSRRKEENLLKNIIDYILRIKNFHLYRATLEEMLEINNLKINLDFDDKMHYYLTKKKKLKLISYDADFDKTDIKRLTPKEALEMLNF